MILGVGLHEILWLVAVIVVGGVVTGLLAGTFGVGGGSVIVPVLFEVFRVLGVSEDVRMQLCVGTSIAIIVPTAFRSYRTHRAKGLGDSGRNTTVDHSRRRRRRLRRDDSRVRSGRRFHGRFRHHRELHRRQASVRRRPLEPWH